MNQTERQLVEKLSQKLRYKFERIEIHRKPSASPKVKNYLRNELGYIPILQPELDMIFWDRAGRFSAVEVKAFNPVEDNRTHPFYEGIGQALALHRFGFDHVALWFMFLDVDINRMNQYGAEAWTFAQRDLKLPLDFTYFRVIKKSDDDFEFRPLRLTSRQSGVELIEINDPDFPIHFVYKNPMKNLPVQRVIRRALELWLDNSI